MSVGHDIAMALRGAYWAMHRDADAALAPHGVTAHQFVLMSLLADHDGITQQDLVRRASSDANTVRAMLVLLERQGLVARRAHPRDGRARSVSLTVAGHRTYARLRADSAGFRERLAALFEGEEAEELIERLTRVTRGMSAGQTMSTEGAVR